MLVLLDEAGLFFGEKVLIRTELLQLDAAAQDAQLWRAYKTELQAQIIQAVRSIHCSGSEDPPQGTALNETRMLHDLLYVADRIRRDAVRRRVNAPVGLLRAAEEVLSKANVHSVNSKQRRSAEEERYAVAARVNWHKLINRARESNRTEEERRIDGLVVQTLDELIAKIEHRQQHSGPDADDVMGLLHDLRAVREKCSTRLGAGC